MYPRHPEHLKTFNYLGVHRYFLTFCCHQRRSALRAPEQVSLVYEQILRAARREHFAILAYCFMSDHAHLLVEGRTDASDCRRFIALAKQYSGYFYRRRFGERLWQRYGYERVLRSDEATISVARYILENPLRAGLVARVPDYAFVGSDVWPMEQILEAVQLPGRWYGRRRGA